MKAIELLGQFDHDTQEHITRTVSNQHNQNYLRKSIQNELIEVYSNVIRRKIVKEMSAAIYYAIIVDCTPEQMSIVLRFVEMIEPCNCPLEVRIREHFVGFIQVDLTDAASLLTKMTQHLKDIDVSLDNLRGQGYDNGVNMSGRHSGI